MVGDDAQAIYGFRAATVRNILDFPARHPGARTVVLAENYRSTPELLEVTNRVIAQARERHPKELWSRKRSGERPELVTCADEAEQTEFVLGRILARREQGLDLRRQAVLFRASHHSLHLEVELGRRGIPFHKYGGLRFVETAHVRSPGVPPTGGEPEGFPRRHARARVAPRGRSPDRASAAGAGAAQRHLRRLERRARPGGGQ